MSFRKHLSAAGGVVFKKENGYLKVTLIFRKGVWDLPKGKLEAKESIEECAVREVAEEIGIPVLPKIKQLLTDTYHEYEQEGVQYGKTTHWFAMEIPSGPSVDFNPQTEEGIEKVKWVSLDEAIGMVEFENLVEVLKKFKKWNTTQNL